jgi:hypothetical protein
MASIYELHQSVEADIDHTTETFLPPLHHQWPQLLGQELFALEHAFTDLPGVSQQPLTNQDKAEQEQERLERQNRERIRADRVWQHFTSFVKSLTRS